MSHPAECSGNTTECLLRALYGEIQQANNKYDWSGITFAFTVGIGTIALWFAIVPILQGLFFPPDRMKYDTTAIGPWSNKKQRRWNWGNLTFLITICTPVINLPELVNWLEQQEACERERAAGRSLGGKGDNLSTDDQFIPLLGILTKPYSKLFTPKVPVADIELLSFNRPCDCDTKRFVLQSEDAEDTERPASSAGWLTLLSSVGIDDMVFKISRLKPSLATIIPSDIPAAVAYGDVQSIVALSALAGCKSMSVDDRYPTCRGSGVQLDFRYHPSLGTVAAFTKYGLRPAYKFTTREDVKLVLMHSRGTLLYRGKSYEHSHLSKRPFGGSSPPTMPWAPSGGKILDFYFGYAMFVSDIPPSVRVFPTRYLKVHALASACAAQDWYWTYCSGPPEKHTTVGIIPIKLPVPCNFMLIQVRPSIELYTQDEKDEGGPPHSYFSWHTGAFNDETKPAWRLSNQDGLFDNGQDRTDTSKSIILLGEALHACQAWLRDPQGFRQAAADEDKLRGVLLLQLRELDFWLHRCMKHNHDYVTKLTTRMFSQSLGYLKVSQQFKDLNNHPVQPHCSTETMNQVVREIYKGFNRGSIEQWRDGGELEVLAHDAGYGYFWSREDMEVALRRYRTDFYDIKGAGLANKVFNLDDQYLHPPLGETVSERRLRERELGRERIRLFVKIGEWYEEELRLIPEQSYQPVLTEAQKKSKEKERLEEEEGLRYCLVLRAISFGALLDTGADNSGLIHMDIAKQIVPLL